MSIFGILLLCTQAFLIQNAYSQCIGPGIDGFGPYGPGPALAGPLGGPLGPVGAYGGAGVGDVAVAGELPVAGTTLVAGQVPILGAVEFGGIVPAAGAVTISGACGCGCAGPFVF